jgi:hypothetical protein
LPCRKPPVVVNSLATATELPASTRHSTASNWRAGQMRVPDRHLARLVPHQLCHSAQVNSSQTQSAGERDHGLFLFCITMCEKQSCLSLPLLQSLFLRRPDEGT